MPPVMRPGRATLGPSGPPPTPRYPSCTRPAAWTTPHGLHVASGRLEHRLPGRGGSERWTRRRRPSTTGSSPAPGSCWPTGRPAPWPAATRSARTTADTRGATRTPSPSLYRAGVRPGRRQIHRHRTVVVVLSHHRVSRLAQVVSIWSWPLVSLTLSAAEQRSRKLVLVVRVTSQPPTSAYQLISVVAPVPARASGRVSGRRRARSGVAAPA